MKSFLQYIFTRVTCYFNGHDFGTTVRGPFVDDWHDFEIPLPFPANSTMLVRRRNFTASQTCLRCQHVHSEIGYDQRPHYTDAFENTKKTASNSKGLHLTEEEFSRIVGGSNNDSQ